MEDSKMDAKAGDKSTGNRSELAPTSKRETDVEAFLKLLPPLVASFASKHNDPKTVSDLSVQLAREETAHLVTIGCCEATLMCRDGRPLALLPGMAEAGTPQNPFGLGSGQNRQGALVAQFPNTDVQRVQGL